MLSGALSGVGSGAAIGSAFSPIGSLIGAGIGGVVGLVSGLFGSKKGEREAQRRRDRYNAEIEKANTYIANNFINNANNIDYLNDNRLESEFYADGGYTPSSALAGYIKSKEYFVPYVYDDRGGDKRKWDPNNKVAKNSVATIGYGFTDKELINSYLSSGKQMTKEEADKRLEFELNRRIKEVSSLPNFHRLTQHQQDAIMALDYAVGFGNIKKNKALYQALESGNSEELANVFYNYTLGMKDPRIAKGIRKAWDSLGNMAKYGEYKNPYSGQVIENKGLPYKNAGAGYIDNAINAQNNIANDIRLAEEQIREQVLHPLINWDELPKISGLSNYTFAEGGPIDGIENYTEFNAGGTHEENPNNGIQFGADELTQKPLKAEEGEVKVGDYIFSNRINPDVSTLKVLGLPQNENLSYADIAKNLKKKLDRRPNDEIMKKYYNQTIDKLKEAQESTKRLREKAKENIIANASHSLGLVSEPNENISLENSEGLFAEGGSKNNPFNFDYLKYLDKRVKSQYPPENYITISNNITLNGKRNMVHISGVKYLNEKNKNYKTDFISPLTEYADYKLAKENYLHFKSLSKSEKEKLRMKDPNYYNRMVNFSNYGILVRDKVKNPSYYKYKDLPNDLTDNEFLHEVGLPTYGKDETFRDVPFSGRGKVIKTYFDTDSLENGKPKKINLDSTSLDEAYNYYKNGNRIVGLNQYNEKMSIKVPKNLSREEFAKFMNKVDTEKLSKDLKSLEDESIKNSKTNDRGLKSKYVRDNVEVFEKPLYSGKKDNTKNVTLKDYYNKNFRKYFKDSPKDKNIYKAFDERVHRDYSIPEGFKDSKFILDGESSYYGYNPKTKKMESIPSTFGEPFKRAYPKSYENLKRAYYDNNVKNEQTPIPLKPGTKSEDYKTYNLGVLPEVVVKGKKNSIVSNNNSNVSNSNSRNLKSSTNSIQKPISKKENSTLEKPKFEFTPEQMLGIRNDSIKPSTPTLNIPKETIGLPEVTGSGVRLKDVVNANSSSNNTSNNSGISNILGNFDETYLRYAPALNAGLNLLTDTFGITNYDDFTTANAIENEYRKTFKHVAPNLISGELSYNPFDTDFAVNKLQSQGAANRQSIINNAGGNRATATAGLLASDKNLYEAVGNEMIKAQEYNNQQRRQIEEFNRQKDTFNAQQLTANQQLNNSIDAQRIQGIEKAMAMREQEKAINAQNRSVNRNMFAQILGQIGREEQDRRFVNTLAQYQIEGSGIKYNKNK